MQNVRGINAFDHLEIIYYAAQEHCIKTISGSTMRYENLLFKIKIKMILKYEFYST